MPAEPDQRHIVRHCDGRTWRIGQAEDVAWLGEAPAADAEVSIPATFETVSEVGFPEPVHGAQRRHDEALVALLGSEPGSTEWWLGYLETGLGAETVFYDVPKVALEDGDYVLVLAGPEQALGWRESEGLAAPWRGALPETVFPGDRRWLLWTPWDAGVTYIAGPASLARAAQQDPEVGPRVRVIRQARPAR